MTRKRHSKRRVVTTIIVRKPTPSEVERRHEIAQAKADVLREAARDLGWFGAQGNLIEPDRAWSGVTACMDSLQAKADRLEAGEPV